MQLHSLHLENFASYRDRTIALRPGLTVLYGRNEVGKTTLLEAVRTLLFGVASRKRLDWYEDWSKYRLTAEATLADGRKVAFTRSSSTKRPIDGRFVGSDDEFDEATLHRELATSAVQYRGLFGFSQQELAEGEQLIERDDLRDVLFGGGVGDLPRFRRLEASLTKQLDQMMTDGSRTREIDEQLKAVAAAQRALDAAQTKPANYAALRESQSETTRRVDRLEAKHRELQREARGYRRRIDAYDDWLRRAALDREIAGIELPVRLPSAVAEAIRQDFRKRKTFETQREQYASEITVHEEAIEAAAAIPGLLDAGETIRDLGERRGQIVRDRQRIVESEDRLAELGKAEPPGGEPCDPEQIRRLQTEVRELRGEAEGVREERAKATATAARLARELDLLGCGDDETEDDAAWHVLARVVRDAESVRADLTRLPDEVERLSSSADAARRRLEALLPGAPLDEELDWPLESAVQEAAAELQNATVAQAEAARSRDAIIGDLRSVIEEIERTAGDHEVCSAEELRELRRDRDRLLAELLDGPKPAASSRDAAERAVEACDRHADERFADAERQASLASLRLRQSQLEARKADADTVVLAAETAIEAAETRWSTVWARVTDTPASPDQMQEWGELHRRWIDATAHRDETAESLRHAERVATRLLDAAKSLGCGHDAIEECLAWCDTELERVRQQSDDRRRRREAEPRTKLELADATTQVNELDGKLDELDRKTATIAAAIGLEPSDAGGVSIDRLDRTLSEQLEGSSRRARVDEIEAELASLRDGVAAFEAEAVPLVDAFADVAAATSIDDSVRRLNEARLNELNNKTKREAEATQIERLERRIAGVDDDLGELLVRLNDARTEYGLETLHALKDAADRVEEIEKRERERADLDKLLAIHAERQPLEAFLVDLEEGEPDEWTEQAEQLEQDDAVVSDELNAARKELGAVEQSIAAIGREGDVVVRQAELEHERSLLRDLVERYVPLALLRQSFGQAKLRFEREMQSSLLDDVSKLLAELTDGTHVAVRRSIQDDALRIIERDGDVTRERNPENLSTGTRQLLYMAIRLAFIRQHVRGHHPIPVLLDDVLVHLDDDRARLVLKTLADLSQETQVVVLSCHGRILTDAAALGLSDAVQELDRPTPDAKTAPAATSTSVSGATVANDSSDSRRKTKPKARKTKSKPDPAAKKEPAGNGRSGSPKTSGSVADAGSLFDAADE